MTYNSHFTNALPTLPPSSHSSTISCSPSSPFRVQDPVRQSPQSIHLNSQLDHNGFEDIILAPPTAVAYKSQTKVIKQPTVDCDGSIGRNPQHQRSLTNTFFDNCRPLVSSAQNSITSIGSQVDRPSIQNAKKSWSKFISSRTPASEGKDSSKINPKAFGDWFTGTCAPVSFGVVHSPQSRREVDRESEDQTSDSEDEMDIVCKSRLSSRPTTPRKSTAPSTIGKFPWFGSKASSAPIRAPDKPEDDLLDLNIDHELFPNGSVDPLAPSSFHDLLDNAEKLILRLQEAYKSKCEELWDAEGEESVLEEELEEADTRARHLKIQLDDMAAKAIEQDRAMKALSDELALERLRRREEEDARRRSVVMVRSPLSHGHVPISSKHRSRGSAASTVDSGFESEGESCADSILSRDGLLSSPTRSLSPCGDADVTPKSKGTNPPATLKRSSTYDKVLKSMPHHQSPLEEEKTEDQHRTCSNCNGGNQLSAWSTVSTLRDQNKQLNKRVQELENTVDGCLDLVAGLGL
ncbi:hypothetical protein M501DRAFT_929180 [Patellaria atrata CBS 101060]|uniref:Uncharacterized protein n=1 Tax=Patellaria atrata CBS 101060 TaxID=1346257 RepID=A0A9P4VV86_9PEZI|nr:hypothetical protein M501DRAFT_929180 [Patellaria atrata CBS 101060]